MATSKRQSTMVTLSINADEYGKIAMTPWFNFKVKLPVRPLPAIHERPQIRTKRLIIRPLELSNLEEFHRLRSQPETQCESTTRGRPDHDLAETEEYLEMLQQDDQAHWYFGAFLASTDELIGEGGLPDCLAMPRSGWPEAEILIKPEYWRQGYGTELWTAIMDSWWALPREVWRHQLLPAIVPHKEPGDEVTEGVGFMWEGSNIAARSFFAKMLGQSVKSVSGTLDTIDMRDGRVGHAVSWQGTVAINPNADSRG